MTVINPACSRQRFEYTSEKKIFDEEKSFYGLFRSKKATVPSDTLLYTSFLGKCDSFIFLAAQKYIDIN